MKRLINILVLFKQWILSVVIKRFKYEGWKGNFVSHYFNHLDEGEWVKINRFKYYLLKIQGYTVRKTVL